MTTPPISTHEWLEADGLGGFASGTSTGIRTRRYHALLLTASTLPTGRLVLVNGFDAWIETPAGRFDLTSQNYLPDVIGGDGAQRIEHSPGLPRLAFYESHQNCRNCGGGLVSCPGLLPWPATPDAPEQLSSEQFAVTPKCGTEPPFRNTYWDNHKSGLYVDVVSGEPLFSSLDKFDFGTGWPSFTQPVKDADIIEKKDSDLGMIRTEVRSKTADPLKAPAHETAVLAGGCFWGMEEIIRKIPGVIKTKVGYSGGTTANPTYEDVSTGGTGHAEAIQVELDSTRLSYETLLDYFFRMHDPTTLNRQLNVTRKGLNPAATFYICPHAPVSRRLPQ